MQSQNVFPVGPMMGLGFFGLIVYVVVKGLILEPAQERSHAQWKAFEAARTVQVVARMHYYPKDVTEPNLEKPFRGGMPALSDLIYQKKRAGHHINTGYPENSIGNALSLSNAILTGSLEPVMLPLNDMREELNERERELSADAKSVF